MTDLEQFEAWLDKSKGEVWRNSPNPLFAMFAAWQAATAAALERAAEEVEKIDKENWFAWQCAFSKHAAEAIRALKERP